MGPWLAEFLHEMTIFPKGKHDDQVDSGGHRRHGASDWHAAPDALIDEVGLVEPAIYNRQITGADRSR